jgi:hypothetical protein
LRGETVGNFTLFLRRHDFFGVGVRVFDIYFISSHILFYQMDPLSALGVAASVVQFIQFGSSLVSKSHELYTHGGLQSNIDCEEAVQRLIGLTKNVKTSLSDIEGLGRLSENSKVLKTICERCASLADCLLVRLNALRIDDKQKHRKWKSFRQAMKSICSKCVVDSLARKLAECRDEVNSHLLLSIK